MWGGGEVCVSSTIQVKYNINNLFIVAIPTTIRLHHNDIIPCGVCGGDGGLSLAIQRLRLLQQYCSEHSSHVNVYWRRGEGGFNVCVAHGMVSR